MYFRPLDENRRTYGKMTQEEKKFKRVKKDGFSLKNTKGETYTDCDDERRIIDLKYFLHGLKNIAHHSEFGCGLNNLDLQREKRKGLLSKLTFKCNMCNKLLTINTSNPNPEDTLNLNMAAVSGMAPCGIGLTQFSDLLTAMNIPSLSQPEYESLSRKISIEWEKTATLEMEKAAEREKKAAFEEGRVKDGKAVIDVIVDGFWSKRSYKSGNYSALSGGAAIIGRRFKEVLYLGIKNKYCCVCARAATKEVEPKPHTCYKNYTGPSTGMESEIILEGFQNSIPMYDMIYGRMIGDGDCNTYKKIVEARPYAAVTVEKIECRNHLLRNMCTKLASLTKDTTFPKTVRDKITTQRILAIRKVICSSVKYHKNGHEDISVRTKKLYLAINNSYNHAFGQHCLCESYYCQSEQKSENVVTALKTSAIWPKIQSIVGMVASNSRSLIHDVDSNSAETYNSVVAKFVGGKRVNYSLRQDYRTRCLAAVVSYNTKKSLHSLGKNILGHSPKTTVRRRFEENKIKKGAKRYNARKIKFTRTPEERGKGKDENYGDCCEKPDLDKEQYDEAKETFLQNLVKTKEERDAIEKATVLQRDSSEWLELRRNMITASNFGKIINKKETTGPSIVKSLLYKTDLSHVASIRHGIDHEKIALDQLSEELQMNIQPCGLFIDDETPYLGATPDGLIDEDKIVEIKCPLSIYHYSSLEEAIKNKKLPFYKSIEGRLEINKKHHWYYQVQGQLHITKRKCCMFAVWYGADKPLKIERIERDDEFWQNEMFPKLKAFYTEHLLPELVDPRRSRNMEIRNPTKGKSTKRKGETLVSANPKRKTQNPQTPKNP